MYFNTFWLFLPAIAFLLKLCYTIQQLEKGVL